MFCIKNPNVNDINLNATMPLPLRGFEIHKYIDCVIIFEGGQQSEVKCQKPEHRGHWIDFEVKKNSDLSSDDNRFLLAASSKELIRH